MTATGQESVLYSFTGGADGAIPLAGLIFDNLGFLYGTTSVGGASGNGVVFKLDNNGKETLLYSFTGGADGSQPSGSLLIDSAGNLYGTTSSGGVGSVGVVFKLDTNGVETVLHSFLGGPLDGGTPTAGLIQDEAGNFYGTTSGGGALGCSRASGCGVVFKLDSTGAESLLYSFMGGLDGPDGATPKTKLVQDAAGNLYGTTFAGAPGPCYRIPLTPPTLPGAVHCGTVFRVDATGKETILHGFTGGNNDGARPEAGLYLDAVGNLYGTTFEGGSGGCSVPGGSLLEPPTTVGCGTVFRVDAMDNESVLYSFPLMSGGGVFPMGGLAADASGNLYGTTSSGGTANFGTVFRLSTAPMPPDFSVSPASTGLTLQRGDKGTDVITIAPLNGSFPSAVELTCTVSGPSPMPTCAFSMVSLTPGASPATSTLTITVPASSAMLIPERHPEFAKFLFAAWLPLLFGMSLVGGFKKRRIYHLVLGECLALLALSLGACGGGSSNNTMNQQPTIYTVAVMGSSGSIQHTAQVTVTAQ